jgi:Cytosol aminopeptidase family, N-terminal domain
MEIRFVPLDLSRIDSLRFEAVALSFFDDERPLRGASGLCDWRLCGRISRLLASKRVTGAPGEVTLLPVRPRLPFDKLVLFGLGRRAEFSRIGYDAVVERMFCTLEKLRLRTFVVALPGRGTADIPPGDAIRWFVNAAADQTQFDEVVVIDDLDAQKAMGPVVETERRRIRAARTVDQ